LFGSFGVDEVAGLKSADKKKASTSHLREALLATAEERLSTKSFNALSANDVAQAAGVSAGSVRYHFETKDGLLLEIYRRYCGLINLERTELLAAAKLEHHLQDRLEAIIRAYLLPAFSSGGDSTPGGVSFTRLRAIMSAEGNGFTRRIALKAVNDTSHAFIDAIHESLPHISRADIVWRSHFLLGALYYTVLSPDRVTRLSRGGANGADVGDVVEQLVRATVALMQADTPDRPIPSRQRSAGPIRVPANANQDLR
jgi:AcrR family transcriptional regulator